MGTVSRVLNGNETVDPAIGQRVLDVVERLDYRPNALAQSLRARTSRSVGLIVSSVSDPLFATMVNGAETVLSAAGYTVMLANSFGDTARERSVVELLNSRRSDGLIIGVSSQTDPDLIATLKAADMPLVLWERELPLDVDSVRGDHAGGIQQALRLLFQQGHTRIGLITAPAEVYTGMVRVKAFLDMHKKQGLTPNPKFIVARGYSADYGFYEANIMLQAGAERPTALLAGGNQMVGVLKAIRMLGVEVPRQLSLICLRDPDLATLVTPQLTVIRWDIGMVGRLAAGRLTARIEGDISPPQHLIVPTEIVLRESCAPPETDNRKEGI